MPGTNNRLDVVVDGVIYESQTQGGISRLFNEILLRMCEADDSLHITLLTSGQLRQMLPQHRCITHHSIPNLKRYLRPNRIWQPILHDIERFMCYLWTGTGKGKIWHSTYYTMPEKWAGYSVVTVHDMVFELFPQFYSGPNFDLFRRRKRLSIQQADAVICVSDTTRKDILRLYEINAERVFVIHNAYSEVFRRSDNTESRIEKPFLLYVGSRAPYKNFDLLAKAYSAWSRHEEVALVLLGNPWTPDEKQHLTDLGIYDRIQLLSNADDETLCHFYNQAVGFVHPSLYEGFGIPLLEAMACGCPVIASRIPSTIEVAGTCPIYFDPTEGEDLLNALDIALSQGRNSKGVQEGLETVKSYSWNKTAAQTLEVYRAIQVN